VIAEAIAKLRRAVSSSQRARSGDWRLAARMTVAGMLSYGIAEGLALPQSFWAVLTAIIVTQASVGASVKAMSDRLLGTIAGAIWGVVVSMMVPHQTPLGMGFALALAIAPLSMLAATGPAYRIAPVTAIILLLSSNGLHTNPLTAALDRVLEIAIGCAIAMGVSLVVLSTRASSQLAVAVRNYLDPIAEQLQILLKGLPELRDEGAINRLHRRIRANLAKVEAMAVEATRERKSRLSGAPDPEPLLRALRRLRHDLALLARATEVPLPDAAMPLSGPAIDVSVAMAGFLGDAGRALVARKNPPPTDAIHTGLVAFDAAITALRAEGATRALSDHAVGRLFALAFVLEELASNLDDLAARIRDYAR